ncbi:phage tail protein, partial [Klebsiella pneumoniae]
MMAINFPPLHHGGRILADFAMCNRFSKNLDLKEAAKRDVGTGDKQLPDMSAFTFSRNGQNGWDVLPNG